MEKILIVDDDEAIRKLIKDFLQKEGYKVDTAQDGKSAINIISKNPFEYQLVILDIMLPDISGTDICRQIRNFSSIPIIMLTARSEDEDKIFGFEVGADDYITKPFNPKELIARIKALLRRYNKEIYSQADITFKNIPDFNIENKNINKEESILIYFKKSKGLRTKVVSKIKKQLNLSKIGKDLSSKYLSSKELNGKDLSSKELSAKGLNSKDLNIKDLNNKNLNNKNLNKTQYNSEITKIEIQPKSRKIFVNEQEIKLTKKEYDILLYFIKNKNIVVNKEKLLEDIWGYDFIGQSRTIDVHIKELRKKIKDFNGDLIETIWAVGYRFNYDEKLNK